LLVFPHHPSRKFSYLQRITLVGSARRLNASAQLIGPAYLFVWRKRDEGEAVSGFQRLLIMACGGLRLTYEFRAKSYGIFIGRKEYSFALWIHSYKS